MLHFKSMTLNNFGPYKGNQTVSFSDQQGVTIFWGNNGRGKTTLLNAFRYALFGVVQRRNGTLKDLSEMENTEARKENQYGFSIKLVMQNDADLYELTRQHRLKKNITVPKGEEDYERIVFLKKNGAILSADDRDHELNVIMPEQVSRFFLFDAELLQEYEELLEIDTVTGSRIKSAIEKILGVPVLQNGVSDIQECLKTYENQRSKAAQKDEKTLQLGKQLEAVEANINEHRDAISEQASDLSRLLKDKADTEEMLQDTENLRKLMDDRDNAIKDRDSKQEELNELNEQLSGLFKDAWKGMLSLRIKEVQNNIQNEITALDNKKREKIAVDKYLEEIRYAIGNEKCPVCKQVVSGEVIKSLKEYLKASESTFQGLSEEENERLYKLTLFKTKVDSLNTDSKKDSIKILEERKDKLQIKVGDLEQSIKELKENIESISDEENEADITNLIHKYSTINSDYNIKKKGIEEEKAKVEELEKSKKELLKAISKQAAGGDYRKANNRYELCNKIFAIFDESKSRYREKLRANVEKDATELFVLMTGDKDYTGLKINDNYGLDIKHVTGITVPGRSTGYEHIVALSLIGALHKNAPLRGPIIMDSPFGRLDPINKNNVIQALPAMAEQIILLAYHGEIDNQVARKELANHLKKEYSLKRITSMHTIIE